MESALPHTALGFGAFSLDVAGGRLLLRGEPVHLTPKAFGLLRLLASRAGELVTKREIFEALWPDTHVTDFALSRCVRELRAALGDDAHAPRVLATVHRRGLRFVAAVTQAGAARERERPFVGRERELAAARGWLAQGSDGALRLLRISGEPGVGKTRLAERIAQLARDAGMLVLWSQTPGGEGAPPYDVWRQIFEAQRALGRERRAEDARARTAVEPVGDRRRAFATAVARLRALTRERHALLVLDDLHGADPDSLHLLDHLLQDAELPRIAVACTLRDVGAPAHPRLLEILDAAKGAGRLSLELLGLSAQESAALLEARVGSERARRYAASVHERSGGNPLYVNELAELVPRDDEGGALPTAVSDTLRDVIARRLALVSPLCADVLSAAAVFGEEVALTIAGEVAELGPQTLGEGVGEAVSQRLLAPAGGAPGHVRFAHGLVREVVYERTKPGVRARLHRRAARALEQSGRADPGAIVSALAHHFGRAVLGGDTKKAIHYAMRAGERALALYAFEDAAAHFDAALDALEAEDPLDADRACQAALLAARAHGWCGRGDQALALAGQAVELARRSRSARLFREAVVVASELQPSYARDPRALALIDEALAGADERDLAMRAQLVGHRAMMAFLDADPASLQRGSVEAVALARRAGDASALLEALRVQGFALNQPQTSDAWRASLEERIALAIARGDALHEFHVRSQRFEHCLQTADPLGAEADLRAMGEIAERVGSPKLFATLLATRAGLAIARGPLPEARRLAERALAIGRRLDPGEWWALAQLQLGCLAVFEDRVAEATVGVRRGVHSHAQISLFHASEIFLLALSGEQDEARRRLRALARDGFASVRRDITYPLTLGNLSQSCALLNEPAAAEPLLALLAPYAGRSLTLMSSYVAGCASRFIASSCSVLRRWDEADAHFEIALGVDRANGARVWEAHGLLEWARSQSARGRASVRAARERARAALALAEEIGVRNVAHGARALLGSGAVR